MQNTQRASESESFTDSLSMQSTPAVEETVEDLWAVWPYCWAIDLHQSARERFHSFHEKHTDWKLARFNRRMQQKFRTQFWQAWQRESEDEVLELRLV